MATGSSRQLLRAVQALGVVCAAVIGGAATCAQEIERDPDALPPAPKMTPRFIAPGVPREVQLADGTRLRIEARDTLSAVSDSADLWIARGNAEGTFDPPVFLGAAPSCYGRDLWQPAEKDATGAERPRASACYLAAFEANPDAALVRVYLGGGWKQTLNIPLSNVFVDQDGDGWTDATEALLGTNALAADSDGDRVPDSADRNPLANPQWPVPRDTTAQDIRALVKLAVDELAGCQPGKPFLIMAPAQGLQSLPERPCHQIFLRSDGQVAAQRKAILPLDGKIPTSAAAKFETAVSGGIPRAWVNVVKLRPKDAEVHTVLLNGRIVRIVERRNSGWVVIERRFELASAQ